MEKKFIAMLVCVALMGCIFVSAQDICKTVANVPMVQLNNGVLMPQFGLGTFMQSSGSICEQSCLTALKIGYWDIGTHAIGFVHQPAGDFVGAWRDMGKVRALGISNFDANDEAFEKIMIESRVKPAVLQIECHSYAQRLAIRDKVKPYGIHITCWFLLGGAMSNGALFSLSSDK